MGWEGEGGRVQLSGNESSIYLSLSLSPLSGGARGPALGYSHYLGDVGLGSGLVSHWQHSLHCHHGKRLQRDALISHFSISAGEKTCTQKNTVKTNHVRTPSSKEWVTHLYSSEKAERNLLLASSSTWANICKNVHWVTAVLSVLMSVTSWNKTLYLQKASQDFQWYVQR